MTLTEPVLGEEVANATRPRVLSICLINPRFEPSYWGFDFALPLYPGNKRSTMISGSLPTVAGLCGDHDGSLLDENVEEIDWESLRDYDIVGVTGMNVQKVRIREILLRLREMGVFTVVGGPYVSVEEEFFDGSVRRDVHWRSRNDLAAVPRRLLPRPSRPRPATSRRSRTDMTQGAAAAIRPARRSIATRPGPCNTRAAARSSASSATSS